MTQFVNILDPDYIAAFRKRQTGAVDAVPTPFPSWNRECGGDGGGEGLARGWLITIGGNTKRGKTLLALNMALAALRAAERVSIFSLEMSDSELATRFYAMAGRQRIANLQRGRRFDHGALDASVERLAELPFDSGVPSLFVNDQPMSDLERVIQDMHLLREISGVRWFLVDYIQLLSMGDDDESVRMATRAQKALWLFAKQTRCVVIGLSQFKRAVSEDYTQSPMPQGLFGGGAIEQTADQIVLIDHSLYDYDRPNRVARTWLRLTQRHGQGEEIPILWNYADLTVREGLEDEVHLWPVHKKRKRR